MTDSDTESICELDWSEWNEIQTYLEGSERVYEDAIQSMERLLNQTNEMEEMIEQLHQASLRDLEETGECTLGDRIIEWIQKIDVASAEKETECSSVTSDETGSLGHEEKPTICCTNRLSKSRRRAWRGGSHLGSSCSRRDLCRSLFPHQ